MHTLKSITTRYWSLPRTEYCWKVTTAVKRTETLKMSEPLGEYLDKMVLHEDGFMFPKFSLANDTQTVEARLGEVKAMALRPDDVLVCSYPKSGTHWVGNLTARLLHGVSYAGVVQASPIENAACLGLSMPSPRVLFSHLRPRWLPQEHLSSGGKIVLVLRNPKDVAVSFFNHVTRAGFLSPSSSWEMFFKLFLRGEVLWGGYDSYVQAWDEAICNDKHLNTTVIFYEDLLRNGFSTLKELQEHLGTNHCEETLHEILKQCSFGKLKQEAHRFAEADIIPGLSDADGKFLLFRKGVMGDWKNWFTVAQNETFERVFKDRLQNCKLAQKMGLPTT